MLRHLRDDESGAVAIIVAVMLVAFLGFAALVVDVGHWYNVRRQLQSAADAAAIAGAMDLAKGESNATIWATVEEYAGRNVRGPLENANVIPPTPGGLSDIEDDAVKVAVQSDSGSYFGQVFGVDALTIHAQARAKIGFAYGARGPIPWALSVLRVTRMEATIGGMPVVMHDDDNDGVWTGVAPSGSHGPVKLTAVNSQGFAETLPPAQDSRDYLVVIGSLPASSAIAAVNVPQTTFTSGSGGALVTVVLKQALPAGYALKARAGKEPLQDMRLSDAGTNTYETRVALPTTTDPYTREDIFVEYGKAKSNETISFTVFIRRANYILQDITVSPAVASETDVVQISASTLDFQYGERYQLKVAGGEGTNGDFSPIDLKSLNHSACGFGGPPPGNGGGNFYYEALAGQSVDIEAHIGDIVVPEKGDMQRTITELGKRIPRPRVEWSEWSVNKVPTAQVVVVPVTERIERPTGQHDLKIVAFASFFIESETFEGSKVAIVGRFVEYVSPGIAVGPTPPYPTATKAVYLTSEGVSF